MNNGKHYQHGFFLLGSVVCFFIGNRAYRVFYRAGESNLLDGLNALSQNLRTDILSTPFWLDTSKEALRWGLLAALAVLMLWAYWFSGQANRRPGEEQGSARWGTLNEARRFQGKGNQNLIFSQHLRLNTGKVSPWNRRYARNLNTLVIGGSGSGKTAFIVKPNAHQKNGSYVFTDPKGTLLPEIGQDFIDAKYRMKVFNTKDMEHSMHYNPFAYIQNEKDIQSVISVLMQNTKGEGDRSGEDFWVKAEELWLTACVAYLWYVTPNECTFGSLLVLLGESQVKEEDESFQNPVDLLFDELEEKDPENFAVLTYKQYKNAAGKTAKSILISVSARLRRFNIPAVRELTDYDELELDTLGERKTALFLIMDDTNRDYAFLHAMVVYQLINGLCRNADIKHKGRLPIPVQLVLDEFANLMGKIPSFEQSISVIRSRRISAWIILQSLSQLENLYDKAANIIVDCCDTTIFLGGKSVDTTEKLSKMMGNQSIVAQNNSESKGGQGNYTLSNNIVGRALMDPSELGRLPMDECIVLIAGAFPFRDKKYPTFDQKWFKNMKPLDVAHWITSGEALLHGEHQHISDIAVQIAADDLRDLNALMEPSSTVVQGSEASSNTEGGEQNVR